jgi:hypothetical protein
MPPILDQRRFGPPNLDGAPDQLDDRALETLNILPQSEAHVRAREGSSVVDHWQSGSIGRPIMVDALPGDLGNGLLVVVGRNTDAGGGLLTARTTGLGKWRPRRIADEYDTLQGQDLDNVMFLFMKNAATISDVQDLNYVTGAIGINLVTQVDTGTHNHWPTDICFLRNPTIAGTNYPSGVVIVLFEVDVIGGSGSPDLAFTQAFDAANGNRITSMDYICGRNTTVDANSASGQKVLNVASTTGFLAGQSVIIGYTTANEEILTIDTIQAGVSLTMTANLGFTHTAAAAETVIQLFDVLGHRLCPLQQQFSGYAVMYYRDDAPEIAFVRGDQDATTVAADVAIGGAVIAADLSPVSKSIRPMIYLSQRTAATILTFGETVDNSIAGDGEGTITQLNTKNYPIGAWSAWTDAPDCILQASEIPMLPGYSVLAGKIVALMGDFVSFVSPTYNAQVTNPRLALLAGGTQGATPLELLLSHAEHATYRGNGIAVTHDGYVYVCGTGDLVTNSDSADTYKKLIIKVAAWDFTTILASFTHRTDVAGSTNEALGLGGYYASGDVGDTKIMNPFWDGHRLIVFDDDPDKVRVWVFDKDLNPISVKTIVSGETQPAFPPGSRFLSSWYGTAY